MIIVIIDKLYFGIMSFEMTCENILYQACRNDWEWVGAGSLLKI